MDNEAQYSLDMAAAPLDEQLLFVIPAEPEDEDDNPFVLSIGWWDEEEKRWEGDWRNHDGPYADNDPIAWAPAPALDNAVLEALGLEADDEEEDAAA